LARVAAAVLRRDGVDVVVAPGLRHIRVVRDSAGLTAEQRAANLAGAFRANRGIARLLRDRPVVVVDDLITTGVTLAECTAALEAVGVHVSAAAAVAATQRRQPARPGERSTGSSWTDSPSRSAQAGRGGLPSSW